MDDYMRSGGGAGGTHGGTYPTYAQQLMTPNINQPRSTQAVKAATALTAGGSLLVLSGLVLTGTVIALTVTTPLLVIFSPVLVPAAITVVALIGGFLASGGFGVAALSVLAWIYRYMTGKHPPGADQLEQARMKLAGKARNVRDKAHDTFGTTHHGTTHHHTTTTTTTT